MTKRVYVRCAGVVAAIVVGLMGVSGAQAATVRSQATITIGLVFPGAQFFPVNLAAEKGYFQAAGLDVSVKTIPPAQLLPGLAGGSIQFGVFAAPQPELAAVAGAPVKYLALWAPHPNISFYTAPDITSAAQLKGSRIFYTVPGSTSAILTNYTLHKLGLTAKDFTPVVLGTNAAGFAAWSSGQIDGGINAPPQLQIFMAARPGSHILYDLSKMSWINGALAANMDYAKAHPDVTTKILKAINRGLKRWWKSPTEAENVIRQQTGVDAAGAVASYKSTLTIFTKQLVPVTPKIIKAEFHVMRQNGFPNAKSSEASKAIDTHFFNVAFPPAKK